MWDRQAGLHAVKDLNTDRWQLPDGVSELLPANAWRVEELRRLFMDNCQSWGYELVIPPLIEYLESLLTGTGETLELQTFKFIDQHNGRTLGVRADMTTQVARMDAHALSSNALNRLFYTGTVLRARTDGAGSSRTPLQFGAELFGHAGPQSDTEIIQLMLDNIQKAGLNIQTLTLDMGHVGVYRALIESAQIPPDFENDLFQAILRGSQPEVQILLMASEIADPIRHQIQELMSLSGDWQTVLSRARGVLEPSSPDLVCALDNLESIIRSVLLSFPELAVHIDLAELRGYRYHTGTIFTLYDNGGAVLARGGRYDAIGEAFGHARPATGFSGDLINLARACGPLQSDPDGQRQGIWVESADAPYTWNEVQTLRANGERVLIALQGSDLRPQDCDCDRKLTDENGSWIVQDLDADASRS